ncbi:TauD/TfdA family dioxygenase [Streptomyces durbertensis]|uniref:TauD/TfdA family dioxygenase n=1 Tax=Streptomyces durbertensis TaxID=2448886 RepID=A0ABR6EFF5_9ACTN|nr:TauD/TfdA family dioxygenase [Streptomyces durbertensis]MBB1244060.1 TauD/TfdA family dioxygenase [Streptomyces durbertensis]
MAAHEFAGEVTGFDVASATVDEIGELRTHLYQHRVVVLRDQSLSSQQYQTFMEHLGQPIPHVLQNLTVQGYPSILTISDYVMADGTPTGVLDGGSYWHADMSYLQDIGIATSLYALRAAARSGGTAFADLTPALELMAFRPDLLELLGCESVDEVLALDVVHRFGNRRALQDDAAAKQSLSREQHAQLRGTRHKLIEKHPVTGIPSLFAPSGSAMSVVGLSDAESDRALDALEEFVLKELPGYTHRYQPGDLVIWDNMSTLHRGTGVSATRNLESSRLLHRINVKYGGMLADSVA